MAGVKGKSGGARPGAGRKAHKKPESVKTGLEPQAHGGALVRRSAEPVPQAEQDMLTFLQNVALGRTDASNTQVRAAIAAVQYTHMKKGDGGKKDEVADKAKKAATGRFAAAPAPLALVKR